MGAVYEGVLRELGIEVYHMEKGKPWQNLIEAQFKVELRLADAQFERAGSLEEIHGHSLCSRDRGTPCAALDPMWADVAAQGGAMGNRQFVRHRHLGCTVLLLCLSLGVLVGCSASAHPVVAVRVVPRISLRDQPLTIRVTGLQPNEQVTLDLVSSDANRDVWRSSGVFRADQHGMIRLDRSAAIRGSYTGVHAMGLITMMGPTAAHNDQLYFWHGSRPQQFTLSVHVKTATLASTTMMRQGIARGVTVHIESLSRVGFVGQFWQPPPGAPRHAAVLEFGGAAGGLGGQLQAGLLASRGYPVLDLAYFNEPGLPARLSRIPLEYFAKALTWLSRQPSVDPQHIYTDGYSSGSEAALLLGVYYPTLVHGVLAFSPSNVAICSPPDCDGPSWTLHGKPIPYTYLVNEPHPPDNPHAVIPVERIHGPIALVCGGSDQVWNSCTYARAIMARLRTFHDHYPHVLYNYPAAGHGVGSLVPYEPVAPSYRQQYSNLNGTTPLANDMARAQAWPHLLAFLAQSNR